MKLFNALPILIIVAGLSGCASTEEINAGFRRIDRLWESEYKNIDTTVLSRNVNLSIEEARQAVISSFSDMGMKVTGDAYQGNIISSINKAPTPLSIDEWKKVAAYENPRVKKTGGWMFYMSDDPSEYQVTSSAKIYNDGTNTSILLGFRLDMPSYEKYGIIPSKSIPPMAAEIGSSKFWRHFNEHAKNVVIIKENVFRKNGTTPSISSDTANVVVSKKNANYTKYSYGVFSYEAEKFAISEGCITNDDARPYATLINKSEKIEHFQVSCRDMIMKIDCDGIRCRKVK